MMLAGDLCITEISYNPHDSLADFSDPADPPDDNPQFEFVELTNVGDQPLNLAGYHFTEGVRFYFDPQVLDPGDRVVIVKDRGDFRSFYGRDVRLAEGDDGEGGRNHEFGGRLSNDGELLELRDARSNVVQSFTYYGTGRWPRRADGEGSSLETLVTDGDFNDPRNWRASGEFGGSPGLEGQGTLRDVVINELLTHTDLPQIDAVELYNRTDRDIDMTGWYFSDSAANLFRFEINGPGSVIDANDYRVFDENRLGFGFRGQAADNAFLLEADSSGRPLRFADSVTFGATVNGVTIGTWHNGEGELFPMTDRTFNDANSGPQIGRVIISEFQYHPAEPPPASLLSEDDLEFIELYNRTGGPVNIGHWRLNDFADNGEFSLFTIPPGTTIAAGETMLVLGFDPLANPAQTREFLDTYRIPDSVPLLGPYSDLAYEPNPDQLNDDGETLLLERPEDLLQLGLGYVLVDRVIYSDSDPWPEEADGTGLSLTRVDRDGYGDFAETWQAALPSPGQAGLPGDVNDDDRVDNEDIDETCLAVRLGSDNPRYDHNRDGDVNGDDVTFLVQVILQTSVGDANLDGLFNSSDMVQVFQIGHYEDGIPNNSGWAEGDWNCDREFTSSDMVVAFQTGRYERVAPPVASMPAVDLGLVVAATDLPARVSSSPESIGDLTEPVATAQTASAVSQTARPATLAAAAGDAIFARPVDFLSDIAAISDENAADDLWAPL
jgi:hypothetical protein